MMAHIKAIEKGKADAEEEIRHLKISFVTHKTASEEEMTRLRIKLTADYDQMVGSYTEQANSYKEQIAKLEIEAKNQNSTIRRLESENNTLLRQNENLRHQMNQMDLVSLVWRQFCVLPLLSPQGTTTKKDNFSIRNSWKRNQPFTQHWHGLERKFEIKLISWQRKKRRIRLFEFKILSFKNK